MPHPLDTFPVQKTQDEEEDLETEERLKHRFRCGMNGDHLMGIPFECDLCHFRNLNGFDPTLGTPRTSTPFCSSDGRSWMSFGAGSGARCDGKLVQAHFGLSK